ncbi:TPA: hypothetical protein PNM72_002874 [Listeria monocytogenes]|uniref:Uncharacterized protein n=5 Tax=Listeria TaxID=1637 RepID=A0A3T2AU17_LISMN|nr:MULTISPECIES: hypothetical protein [Bacillota]EAE3715907.1 hypothetical protein [Listeria monocytogenes serotype 1/2c]EAE3752871.1 hypothetical protein [Listeria monocytogenes serotype 1/2a]EAG6257451.1 hypothetical protein [Listeria monocytogenes CFSAN003807]EJN8575480.1 hypothetical protein [Salmonella enterica subsp. enterica serovar Anatum]ALU82715.1 hypothetical protein AUZ28_04750 [Listeria monocytogenes]
MNKVLVSANYEGYESKNINFAELNNIVKGRFENMDQKERKKRADKFNQKFEVTKELVNGHLREIIIPRRTL